MLTKFLNLIIITIALFALNSEAFAKHRHHHRNHHRHHYHWLWYGAPLWVPGYYYYHHRPIYHSDYLNDRVAEDFEPGCNALVESCLRIPATSEPISTTPRVEYSYYCPESKAYYPAVKSCSTSWLRVLPGTVTEIPQ